MTRTEEYIKKAVAAATKEVTGNHISNCNITMNNEADGATQLLAEALNVQAEANIMNSQAMLKLAESLKPIEICAIRISEAPKPPKDK